MSDDEIDMVAAEYVLGTLTGEERALMQSRISGDARWRDAVERWQRNLAPLISAGPVPVPAHIWAQIEALI